MTSACPWKSLVEQSLRRNDKLAYSRYMQLATVRPDGRPANRTVVYRGFLWDTDRLTFVTDARSRKIGELAANPWAELAWYFPNTREQYRLAGKVVVVDKDSTEDEKLQRARVAAWRRMSDSGRQQFLWPEPGAPRSDGDGGGSGGGGEGEVTLFNLPAPGKEGPAEDTFCLCVVHVEEVDHLSLKDNTRRTFRREGDGWAESNVNP